MVRRNFYITRGKSIRDIKGDIDIALISFLDDVFGQDEVAALITYAPCTPGYGDSCASVHLPESDSTLVVGRIRGPGHLSIVGSDITQVHEGARELRVELAPYGIKLVRSRK